ncbi:type II secretion system protein [Candidatus Microgenomates bacterium]|nr:MAG: type II secretion system protein [Candidatus Microgenomates bacterium]
MKKIRGFTLVELIIVMAVIGVLGSLVIIKLVGSEASARDTKRKSDLRQYQNALEVYANDNGGLYPLRASAVNPSSLCGSGQPLGVLACAVDPHASSGTNYAYQTNNPGGTLATQYVLWASLEKSDEYFIVCSDGQVGTIPIASFSGSGNCPI